MPLTDTAIKSAKTTDKPQKLADEKDLFLLLHPNGSQYWRMKYRFEGKENGLESVDNHASHMTAAVIATKEAKRSASLS